MDYAKVCYGSPHPPGTLWFIIGFLAAAVLVTRFRPRWLPALWVGAWLLALHWVLVWNAADFEYEPTVTVTMAMLITGLPTGLTAFWLYRSRHYPGFSRGIVQVTNALAAFVGGAWIAFTVMDLIRERLA